MNGNIPRMDYRQYRAARRLVHECCNYDSGNCLLLEDGEPCVCVCRVSAIRCSAAGLLPLSCPLMKHWKPPSCAGKAGNAALSAGRSLSPNPTGGNTARTAPDA